MSNLSEETVGRFFVDKDGRTWQHITYCEYPTATVRCIDPGSLAGQTREGAVGCRILDDLELRMLVPVGGSEEPSVEYVKQVGEVEDVSWATRLSRKMLPGGGSEEAGGE